MKKDRLFTGSLAAMALVVGMVSTVSGADYAWTGNGADVNWSTVNNWSPSTGYPRFAGDRVFFSAAYAPRQPQLDYATTCDVINLTGPTNWTLATANSTTLLWLNTPAGINHTTTYSNWFRPMLGGNFGVAITSGVLVLDNKNSFYTGGIVVSGGVLDVSATYSGAGVFSTNVASAAGSNSTDVLLGDAVAGLDAELRIGGGGNRGITVQGGAGVRTIRFMGATVSYTGTNTLNADTTYAPSTAGTVYNLNGKVTGTGSVIVAGAGTVGIGGTGATNNDYTGPTAILAGTLQLSLPVNINTNGGPFGKPAAGNEEILLGDTNGTASALIYNAAGTVSINRPLRVRAGSSGYARIGMSNGNQINFNSPLTLEKDLQCWSANGSGTRSIYVWNAPIYHAGSGAGALDVWTDRNDQHNDYICNTPPAHRGGTYSRFAGLLYWMYTCTASQVATLRFGDNATGTGPGTITLNGGQFVMWYTTAGACQMTLENPIIVTTNGGYLKWRFDTAAGRTNLFTGPINLGGRLFIGDSANGNYGRYDGTVTIDQSVPGLCGLAVSRSAAIPILQGAIVDSAIPARNSLLIRANGPLSITGDNNTFANGTVIEADTAAGIPEVLSPNGSLGTGPIWLQEGTRLKLNKASNVAAGKAVQLFATDCAKSLLIVTNNFLPPITADSAGMLGIDSGSGAYSALTDLSALGNGRMYLGTANGGLLAPASLAPGLDSLYRLCGGGNTLSVSNSVLAGAGNALVVGWPGIGINKQANYIHCGGTVKLLTTNSYGGGTTVHVGSTLEGIAKTNGNPFGSTTAGVTLNNGKLQATGISAPATSYVGRVTLTGSSILSASQGNTATNVLALDSFGDRTNPFAPWNLEIATTATLPANYLGGKERVVVANGAPVPVNGMVAPWFVSRVTVDDVSDASDFLTYDTTTDAAGTIGFKPATNVYVTVTNSLAGLDATKVVNAVGVITNTADTSIYALRLFQQTTYWDGMIVTNNGTMHTLTIASGGLIANRQAAIYENISFSNAEGVIHVGKYDKTLTLYGKIYGTNGLTKTGDGGLTLNADNSTSLTGTIAVLQGNTTGTRFGPATDASLGDPQNVLYVSGGRVKLTGGNWYHRIVLGPGGMDYFGPTGAAILYSPISGVGALLREEGDQGDVTFAGTNTWSGGTVIDYRNNFVTATSSLGVGDVTVGGGFLYLYGNKNIGGGDSSTSADDREARLSVYNAGTVYFQCLSPSVGSLSGSGTVNLSNTVLSVGGDGSSTIFSGTFGQMSAATTGSVKKVGAGTFTFKGRSTLNGTNEVSSGQFAVDGAMNGDIKITSGGTLVGGGSAGAIYSTGGRISAGSTNSTGQLLANGLTLDSSSVLIVDVASATNYDRLVVNGPVSLGSATLQMNFAYKPSSLTTFDIVLNSSTNATTGTFAGAPEGKIRALGGGYYGKISYAATGDATAGNDIRISNVTAGIPGTAIMFR